MHIVSSRCMSSSAVVWINRIAWLPKQTISNMWLLVAAGEKGDTNKEHDYHIYRYFIKKYIPMLPFANKSISLSDMSDKIASAGND